MSTSLYSYPTRKGGKHWPWHTLKHILARRYLGHDGSLEGAFELSTPEDIAFLEGVAIGTDDRDIREACQDLVAMIKQHDGIDMELRG